MFESREGQAVPEVTFRARRDNDWQNIESTDLFKGRTVAVFALPGAFTPTCSSSHVPRYNELAPALRAQGVDEIVCMSVNDAFVMEEWREAQRAENISFIPDGNGEFSAGMGMLVDKADLGFGKRSWRYSMLVRDGIVEKMFIEPDQPGDPFEVSDADTMLKYLNADAETPASVTVFSRKGCPFCAQAKQALTERGLEFEELVLNRDFSASTLRAVAGSSLVPQVFIDGDHVGGAEDLEGWLRGEQAA